MKSPLNLVFFLTLFNLPLISAAQDSVVVHREAPKPMELGTGGVPTTGVLRVHCFYKQTIESNMRKKDKAYGELKGAPTYKTHFLEAANVTVYRHDTLIKTSTTDMNGYCEWDDLKEGVYKVKATKEEYKNDSAVNKLVQAGVTINVDMDMKKNSQH